MERWDRIEKERKKKIEIQIEQKPKAAADAADDDDDQTSLSQPPDLRFLPPQNNFKNKPTTAKDGTKHVGLKLDRIRHWLSQGAQPSKPVASLLHRAGVAPAPPRSLPEAKGVRNPEKRPSKTAASFAAAGIEAPAKEGEGA